MYMYIIYKYLYLDKEVEKSTVEGFGKGVSGVRSLLDVEGDLNVFLLRPPFALHRPADDLRSQHLLIDAKQIRRIRQIYR